MTVDRDAPDIQQFLGATAPAPTQSGRPGALPIGLPMPRDRSTLFDPARRVHAVRQKSRRFPFPIPNGWFIVARSDELQAGEVQALYVFGRDLVLFRTESGEPRLLDAHCPHLGAHLAVGGASRTTASAARSTVGASTARPATAPRSPMAAAPASRPGPRRARTRPSSATTWSGPGTTPRTSHRSTTCRVVDEFADPDWLPIECREFDIAVAAQDMAENNVDYSHFRYVHGTDAIPEDEFFTEGTYKRAVGQGGNFVREGYGLGLGVLRVKGWVTFLSSTTPIDEENVHVRWLFTAPAANGADALIAAADSFCDGVSQDIPIWENKIYRPHPVLTKSERPILEHRRWAQQFYSDYDGDPATDVEDET